MATYLYGLLLSRNAARLKLAQTGLSESPVRVIECGSIAALVSTIESLPSHPNLGDVRAHESVAQSAVSSGVTTAAARFGQTFPDDAACCADVSQRRARLEEWLDASDGCVEMRVLVTARAPSESPAQRDEQASTGPGREYLERLRASRKRLEEYSVRMALGPLIRAELLEELPSSGIAIAHLVRASDQPAYRDAIRGVASLAGARVVGPLPLYAFGQQ